jgi:hypothetical protein
MKPVKKTQIVIVIIAIILVWLFFDIVGPLDKIPRLRVSATNQDKTLVVKVYKKRLSFYPKLRVGILVNIYDNQDTLLYDKVIFEDGLWDHDIGEMYSEILFVDDEIWIGPKFTPDEYYVIKKSDLRSITPGNETSRDSGNKR